MGKTVESYRMALELEIEGWKASETPWKVNRRRKHLKSKWICAGATLWQVATPATQ
jgi:hypothetical protein